MVNVFIYTIDGVDYYLLDELVINGIHYLYLSNVNDEEDFIIRKRDSEDKEVLVTLDNEEEVKKVALILGSKIIGEN